MPLPDVAAGATGHISHHNTLHDYTQFDEAVRYVSKAPNASDSNDGLSPFLPKATIQAAYDALPSLGGTVLIGNGKYDIGTRIILDRDKPAHFIGQNPRRVGSTTVASTWDWAGTVLTRAQATYPSGTIRDRSMIVWRGAGATLYSDTPTNVGWGFRFENLIFELLNPTTNTGMTAAFDHYSVNHTTWHNCTVFSKNAAGVFVYSENSTDNSLDGSWGRIQECYVQSAALLRTPDPGNNMDNWVIRDNVWFAGSSPQCTLDGIFMGRPTRSTIADNSMHGTTDGSTWCINIQGAYGGMITGNGGENTLKHLRLGNDSSTGGCHGMYISDVGRVGDTGSTTGSVFIQFDGSCGSNIAILPMLRAGFDGYVSGSTPIIDNTSGKTNWVMDSDTSVIDARVYYWMPHHKRGSGTPNSAVTGSIGDLYVDTAGGASTTLYVKTSGTNTNTGWTAK